LVDPFAAPCRGERQRPFRARSILGIVAVADHDHLWRIASAFAHSGYVFILLPVQAFSALSVKWSGYEGFHRGFSLGAGAKSEAIKAAQSGLDVKRRGALRLVSSREARIENGLESESVKYRRQQPDGDVKPCLERMRVGSGKMQSRPKIGDAKARQRRGEVDLQ
jgi:hypothetical protein